MTDITTEFDVPKEAKLAIIAERRARWSNSLWQSEKVDLVVAKRLGDQPMEKSIIAEILRIQTVLATLDDLEKAVLEEA